MRSVCSIRHNFLLIFCAWIITAVLPIFAAATVQVTDLYEVGQGSVALTTSTTITNQYIYSPYGMQKNLDHPITLTIARSYPSLNNQTRKPFNIIHNQFGYTGQADDPSTNLMMLGGFRNYAPGIGRFIQPDTYNSFSKHSINNPMMYVRGNPMALTDSSGHHPWLSGAANALSSVYRVVDKDVFSFVTQHVSRIFDGISMLTAFTFLSPANSVFDSQLITGAMFGAAEVSAATDLAAHNTHGLMQRSLMQVSMISSLVAAGISMRGMKFLGLKATTQLQNSQRLLRSVQVVNIFMGSTALTTAVLGIVSPYIGHNSWLSNLATIAEIGARISIAVGIVFGYKGLLEREPFQEVLDRDDDASGPPNSVLTADQATTLVSEDASPPPKTNLHDTSVVSSAPSNISERNAASPSRGREENETGGLFGKLMWAALSL